MESSLTNAAKHFRVVALTGARQTGKSTLLKHLFRSTHRFVSLDDLQTLRLAQRDPRLFFSDFKPPLILDEIQYAPQLLSYIKMIVDASSKKGQFLLTGSQQFTLMKNVRETLAGRIALFHLYPTAITEGPVSSRTYRFRALAGAYPERIQQKFSEVDRWYSSYLSTYLEKDVQTHYRIEQSTHFRDFVFLLASRTAQVLNLQSLSSDLGISVPTIKSWVKILEASQLIYLLRPYYVNLGSRIVKTPKVYFTDIGLVCHLTGVRDDSSLWRGPLAGPLFENFVVQEVLKHYSNKGVIAPLYYYRSNNNLEVDLIIERKPAHLIPCEIKLNKTPHVGMVSSIERLRSLNKKASVIENGFLVAPISESSSLTRTEKAVNLETLLNFLA